VSFEYIAPIRLPHVAKLEEQEEKESCRERGREGGGVPHEHKQS